MALIKIIKAIRKFLAEKFNSKNEDLPYYVTIALTVLFFIAGLNAFVELTDELIENELVNFDHAVTDFVQSFKSDGLTAFFRAVTHLGDRYAYISLTIILATYFRIKHRSWKFILQTVTVLILSTFSNVVLKKFINRARPSLEHLVSVDTLSYPSGHSMSAMAFYGFLIYLSLRYTKLFIVRIGFSVLLAVLILFIGISRIYLGVHYPSDVAAGFIGGFIWVVLCALIFNIIDLWRKRKQLKNAVIA
jgi:membrane-associated phospholipid phosphatase